MQNNLKLLLVAALAVQIGLAQNAGTVRGTVTDPSAASVPGATVQITGNGTSRNAKTDGQGKFTITLPPGSYNVRADAKGFTTFLQQNLTVSAGQVSPLDIALQIAAEAQEVQVSDQAAGQVSVDPSSNVGALVLKTRIWMRCRTIRTIYRRISKRWPVRRPVRTERSSLSMVSAAASYPRRVLFAKSASIRTRFRRSSTARVLVALRF